jgi:hypothetical protein
MWLLAAAVTARSDAGVSWLLKHGASLTLASADGRTTAHAFALTEAASIAEIIAGNRAFVSRWCRKLIAAQPSLLEARDGPGYTPLLVVAAVGSKTRVAGGGRGGDEYRRLRRAAFRLRRQIAAPCAAAHRGWRSQYSSAAAGVAALSCRCVRCGGGGPITSA